MRESGLRTNHICNQIVALLRYCELICVDLLVLNISMFILFSNVINETITLLFNSFMGKNHTAKMS